MSDETEKQDDAREPAKSLAELAEEDPNALAYGMPGIRAANVRCACRTRRAA